MESLLQDLRYALRTLRRAPGFATVVVLTLALGIGANTAIFSVVNAVLLRPLPYPYPDQLATWLERSKDGMRLPSYPTFADWREQSRTVDFAYARGIGALTPTPDGSARLGVSYVTPEFFPILGVPPLLGRLPQPGDDRAAAGRVAVISYALWQKHFGGDRSAIGRRLDLDGISYDVIGIMPLGFAVPNWSDAWTPVSALPARDRALVERGYHVDALLIGRLKPGITWSQAFTEMDGIAARIAAAWPAENAGWTGATAFPLDRIFGDGKPRLLLAAAAVGLVLLVACANIATLLMARAETRTREIAVRRALGATRGRLARHVLVESLILTIAGGALGTWAAALATTGLRRAALITGLPRTDEIAVDTSVLAFVLAVCVIAALLFGLLPALQAASTDVAASLKDGAAGSGASGHRGRVRGALVVAEVGLASSLMVGAGLLAASFVQLSRVDPGFRADHLVSLDISPPSPAYDSAGPALDLFRRLRDGVASVPGVRQVALVNGFPLSSPGIPTPVVVNGHAPDAPNSQTAAFRVISAGYFETMGIPLRQGREFTEPDMVGSVPRIVVNESFAKRYLSGVQPLGARVRVLKRSQARPDFGQPLEGDVIGVAADVKAFGLDQPPRPEVYLPYTFNLWSHMFVVARVEGDTDRVKNLLGKAVHDVEPRIPFGSVRGTRSGFSAVAADLSDVLRPQGFSMMVIGFFAFAAVALSLIGVYGVTASAVASRTRDIALRVALGAHPTRVWREAVTRGMVLVTIGLVLGLVAAFLLSRFIASILFGVQVHDPFAYLGTAILFVSAAVVACHLPARRATRVDPMVALRSE